MRNALASIKFANYLADARAAILAIVIVTVTEEGSVNWPKRLKIKSEQKPFQPLSASVLCLGVAPIKRTNDPLSRIRQFPLTTRVYIICMYIFQFEYT